MFNFIKKMLGIGNDADFAALVAAGATIVDVRTVAEFSSGHVAGAINIPLDKLPNQLSKINKNKPVITCCASGMRSARGKSVLLDNGFTEVHNGGAWTSLQNKIKYENIFRTH